MTTAYEATFEKMNAIISKLSDVALLEAFQAAREQNVDRVILFTLAAEATHRKLFS